MRFADPHHLLDPLQSSRLLGSTSSFVCTLAGEGFLSNGSRVGQGVAHDLPPHLAKAKALAAAEERAKKQRLMGPGGKIGGVRKVGKTPRELAADVSSSH